MSGREFHCPYCGATYTREIPHGVESLERRVDAEHARAFPTARSIAVAPCATCIALATLDADDAAIDESIPW